MPTFVDYFKDINTHEKKITLLKILAYNNNLQTLK